MDYNRFNEDDYYNMLLHKYLLDTESNSCIDEEQQHCKACGRNGRRTEYVGEYCRECVDDAATVRTVIEYLIEPESNLDCDNLRWFIENQLDDREMSLEFLKNAAETSNKIFHNYIKRYYDEHEFVDWLENKGYIG